MKRLALLLSLLALCLFVENSWAADKATISAMVDGLVAEIDNGKAVKDVQATAYDPYVFVMEASGMMLVHPKFAGKDYKKELPTIFAALMQASPEGTWVQYTWEDKEKNSYVRMTKNHLVVGSGY